MFKNVASQKLTVRAFATAAHATLDPGEPVTGDAAQITCKVEQDDDGTQTGTDDANPAEIEDGLYVFDMLQAEVNGDKLTFFPDSSTAGVVVVALPSNVLYTRPANFPALGIETDGDVTKVNLVALTTANSDVRGTDGVDTATMRGTDSALTDKAGFSLSTAGILAIWHQLVSAVVTASTMGKLVVDFLNAAVGSIPTTMRGTDNAATETKQDAADGIQAAIKLVTDALPDSGALTSVAQASALGAVDTAVATLLARLTAARAGLLDNLNVGGNVASAADVLGITVSSRIRISSPLQMDVPDASTVDYRIHIYSYNETGTSEDLDAVPVVTAENAAGTTRSSNLGTVTKVGATTGQYFVDYTVAFDDVHPEQITLKVTATENAVATTYPHSFHVVDVTLVGFTSTDRTLAAGVKGVTDALPDSGALTSIAQASALATTDGKVDTLLGRLTAARAGFLDFLNTGVSLAATGLDSIVSTATGMVEIAKANWDRLLTGATHNIQNSGGRIVRQLQTRGGYDNGFVYVDTVNGTAGTEDFENGTINNPVGNIADALTIRASIGLPGLHILPGSTIVLPVSPSVDNIEFIGKAWTLVLAGRSVNNCFIHGAKAISGTFLGNPYFDESVIDAITGPNAEAHDCGLVGPIIANAAGDWFFHHCYSRVAGTGSPSFDFGISVLNTALNLRDYSGGWELKNMGQAGTDTASIEGNGQLILNASCTGGSIVRRGAWSFTDNAGGAVTVTLDAVATEANVTAVGALVDALNDVSTGAVQSSCAAALVAIHLDHLLAATYDATSKPGTADALLNEMVEDNSGVTRYTAAALAGAASGAADETAIAIPAAGQDINTVGGMRRALLNWWIGKKVYGTGGALGFIVTVSEYDDPNTVWKTFETNHATTPSLVQEQA